MTEKSQTKLERTNFGIKDKKKDLLESVWFILEATESKNKNYII
jgi:hypothetical protein